MALALIWPEVPESLPPVIHYDPMHPNSLMPSHLGPEAIKLLPQVLKGMHVSQSGEGGPVKGLLQRQRQGHHPGR